MQVTETVSEGLKREIAVTVGADELDAKLTEKIDEMKGSVRLKGFRPGKVPAKHLRQIYGRSIMSEVMEKTVNETSKRILDERNERPAFQPDVKFSEDKDEMERVIKGEADLKFDLKFEILPEIKITELSQLQLEKPVADVGEEEISKSRDNLVDSMVSYEAKDGPSELDDQVTMDFVGKKDGEPFEGGSAEDMSLVLGKGQFIPGFEEGLIGLKAGDEKNLELTFPEEYHAAELAGQPVVFEVKVKEVAAPVRPEVDDEFAKKMGLESLDQLNERLKERIATEYAQASREKLKRKLLDALAEKHDFDLPPTLVESEFDGIWGQVTKSLEDAKKTFEDEDTTEEKAREKYREIAERRVRLGLVISEIGEQNDISVSDDELAAAIGAQARQYPGQEKMVYEYFNSNPQAVMQMRGPIFEDKVVDFIVELAKIEETTVSSEELLKPDEDDDDEPETAAAS
ncbi:MAG: trigger factor [Pseudomonadota bacterium]